jgi:hypothetical protein
VENTAAIDVESGDLDEKQCMYPLDDCLVFAVNVINRYPFV